jgi:hypothetical protein
MKNLIGKRVGRLLVVSASEKIGNRLAWRCLCSCGKEVQVLQQSLIKYSPTSSCGCLRGEANTKDLSGLKYGLWTVKTLSEKKKKSNGGTYWLSVCICGTEKEISSESLISGRSISCGCSRLRPICPQGHAVSEWGRDKTGMCRACIKNRNFLRNYGVTLQEYLDLWRYQAGKCAICGRAVSVMLGRPGYGTGCRAELDHEHNPNLSQRQQVRGILCGGRWSGCNRKLGRLDKVEWLRSATQYIADPPARRFLNQEKTCPDPGI